MKSIYFLAVVIALSGSKAFASEAECLSRIMHAESRGELIKGIVAIGQATITRADDQETDVCHVTGVKRKQPPVEIMSYYKAIAKQLLDHPSTSVSRGADSWDRRLKVHGIITTRIGKHTFYKQQ